VSPDCQEWITGMLASPGLWHPHFNEGDTQAYLLPIQDAGLRTSLRSVDIRFS